MPTTYAHWRFGDMCYQTLPDKLQKIIKNNRKIYDFGVQGPDIFFYYKCLKKNEVNSFGYDLHEIPLDKTLKTMKGQYDTSKQKEKVSAYLLGLLSHYTLDTYCHSYIEKKEEVSDYSHGKIEAQFDRYLLIKDGYDPIKKKVTFSLKPSKSIAKTIREVYPQFDDKTIYGVLKDTKKYLNLLKDNSDIKRWLLNKAMDLAHAHKYKELIMGKENIYELSDAMLRLDKLMEKAKEHYPILADSLIAYLNNGTTLDPYFKNHFCAKKNYKSIPILSLDAEKNYEVELQD